MAIVFVTRQDVTLLVLVLFVSLSIKAENIRAN